MRSQNRNIKRYLAVAIGTTTAALLVGCSGGSHNDSGATAVSHVDSAMSSDSGARVPSAAAADSLYALSKPGANRPALETRAVISTGKVSLVGKDLTHVRDEINRLLKRYGGFVSREQTSNDKHGKPENSTLQLRIPEPDFDTVMSSFEGFATVKSTHRTSEDVTTQVIDVNSRVATTRDSLVKLRGFLRQTTTVSEIIRLESAITERQADLQSLEGQQRYLDDETSMATIDATLTVAPDKAKPEKKKHDTGFLAGLKGGWNALAGTVVVALTAVGALLPFALVLTLIGIPAWLLVRRWSQRQVPAAEPAPTET